MALIELAGGIAIVMVAILLYLAHKSHASHTRKQSRSLLKKELAELDKQKVNKSLTIAFATLIGLLTMPLLTASATGEATGVEGRLGVLALLAFFTATYAIIAIHSVLGRD